jgi:nitrate reductase gamma subunit
MSVVFGIVIPYAAAILFIVGVVRRIVVWARSPVPFRIPTTTGQQKSLSFIRHDKAESPSGTLGVIGRMALEILLFRSLFRNTRARLEHDDKGPKFSYIGEKWLWLGAIAFHYCFLIILLRHLRFFIDPVPSFVLLLQDLDGFFQVGVPTFYITTVVIVIALLYLLLRRLVNAHMRYISLPADYVALLLLLGVALSGALMRHSAWRTDIVAVKEYTMGLVNLHPVIPERIGTIFFVHITFISLFFAYFPFSKLMHAAGILMSPTRNLANNNRARRHVNPWDYPVEVHTYHEWEEEFRDKMLEAGYVLDKE